jgi:DNA-binding NtrC family response regulator
VQITGVSNPHHHELFLRMPTINSIGPMEPIAKSEMPLLNLLIVDDERTIREGCKQVAEALGFTTYIADSAERAYAIVENSTIDVVLLDLRLPGVPGIDVLREIKRRRPETLVVVLTGYATVHSAVQAMKSGAYDYVTKPFNIEELRLLLHRVTKHLTLTAENRMLREQVKSKQGFGTMVGNSPAMQKLYKIITKAANSTHPVLILGETGTGKELVARSIHFTGPNRACAFIPVDCGSLAPTLIESELFGHVKGAFTGANNAKDGLLVLADGGTVFLDEIGELPLDLQAKLLRALQEKEVRPVGGTKSIPVNVRVLAATNRDLEQEVAQGRFRRDLYFRLNVLTLRIPMLRERKSDIPLLVGSFLEKQFRATAIEHHLSDEALRLMLAYDWPGNVRELQNCIERACTNASYAEIRVGDLPTAVRTWQRQTELQIEQATSEGIVPLAQLEKQAILQAIHRLHGDKLEAARQLGIGKTTLYRKLKEYGALV